MSHGAAKHQPDNGYGGAMPLPGEVARTAIEVAKHAIALDDELLFQQSLDTLVALPELGGQRIGCTVVESVLLLSIRSLWAHGWQPLDVAHFVEKRMGAEHRSFLVAAIGVECITARALYVDERWRGQLTRIGAIEDRPASDVSHSADSRGGTLFPRPELTRDNLVPLLTQLRLALEVIEFAGRMPSVPLLVPPPAHTLNGHQTARGHTSHLDAKILDRVRALLAKAESTTFEEEAGALTSKAQQLMARHAIDIAMLDSQSAARVGATARRIHIDDPYLDAKSSLLSVVAMENRCKAVSTSSLGFVTVFGFDTDLDIVELLFTSLLTQATTSMIAAGSTSDRTGRSRTKSFRQAFLVAFASRIGERLRSASASATEEASRTFGDSLLPVLTGRTVHVEELSSRVFPKVKYRTTNISNEAGWVAGRNAADTATIDVATGAISRP